MKRRPWLAALFLWISVDLWDRIIVTPHRKAMTLLSHFFTHKTKP